MLKTLLNDIATANGWVFQYGTPAMFNVSADMVAQQRPVLFMAGFGKGKNVRYDAQGAVIPTYRLELYLVVHSKLTDLSEDRTTYFDEVDALADRLSSALYKQGSAWEGESRFEVINVNDANLDGLRITGNLTLDRYRIC